jgi:hypothetical protein
LPQGFEFGVGSGKSGLEALDLGLLPFLQSLHLLMLLGHIGLHPLGHLAFLVCHGALESVKSLDGPGAGPVPATVRVVVVARRGETFPSLPSFFRAMDWGDLPSVFREWAGRPSLADRSAFIP